MEDICVGKGLSFGSVCEDYISVEMVSMEEM